MNSVVENTLPKHWKSKTLGEVCDFLNGYAFKSKEYVTEGFRVIRIKNVQSGVIEDNDPKYFPLNRKDEIEKYILNENDLLISLTGNVGRVGLISHELLPAVLNQRVGKISIHKEMTPKFLFYRLRNSSFAKEAIDNSNGSAQLNLSSDWIMNYQLAIPPLDEQKRIVAKIDTLFAKIDKAISLTEESLKQAKNLLSSVLKEVFEKGKADGWEEKKLGEVLDNILTGTTPSKREPKYYENPTVSWFSPSDLGVVKVLEKAKNKVSQLAVDERKVKLFEKDSLLLVAIGATIGKVGIIRTKVSSNQQITALKFNSNLNIEFAYYYFIHTKPTIVKIASTATMPIINQKSIKSLSIVFPSILIQENLVTSFNSISDFSNKTQSKLEEQLAYLKQLKSSILSKAFKGEL
jgi:type I restriction enzyme, S subunit